MKIKVVFMLLLLSLAAAAVRAKEMRPAGVTAYGETLLTEINLYRRENGLNSLRFDPLLIQLAQKHSFEMFQGKMLSHSNFKSRFERSGSRSCVENVGWNYPNPLKMFESWRGSRGHDENMLKEGVRKVGIAEVGKYVTYFACQ